MLKNRPIIFFGLLIILSLLRPLESATINLTPINTIQGTGHISPLRGQQVKTQGIVTATGKNGFYIQSQKADNNINSSEALFILTGKGQADQYQAGDNIEARGKVMEYRAAKNKLSITQIIPESIKRLSRNNPLPTAVIIGRAGRSPPTEIIDDDKLSHFDPQSDAIDFYESLESMRVSIVDPVVVGPNIRFNEIWVLANRGKFATRLNRRGGITIDQNDFNPERIKIHLDKNLKPRSKLVLNVGDGLTDVTGILSYRRGNFEVLTTTIPQKSAGHLGVETTELIGSTQHLTIASFNLKNLDPDDSDGNRDIANGRFKRLARQIVINLHSPDILALQEIEDNSGTHNNGIVSASLTAERLIESIESVGGPRYHYLDIAPSNLDDGGKSGSNIRVAYLYNQNRVKLDKASAKKLFHNEKAFAKTRKPLVAEFSFKEHRIQMINLHLSSKIGSSPLFGQKQPPTNAKQHKRHRQAQLINQYVKTELSIKPNKNIIVLGDINEFDFNPALKALVGKNQLLTNLVETLPVEERYSFNRNGNSRALDHMLVSQNLLRYHAPEFDMVHCNSEFANRASDHDPIIMRLRMK